MDILPEMTHKIKILLDGLIHIRHNPTRHMIYDQTDPKSIEEYAQRAVGRSLREAVGTDCITYKTPGKGGFGQILEEMYFGIKPGNRPEPDFLAAGVELKSFPVKRLKNGKLVAKERVSLGMIDYGAVVDEEWETSTLLKKNKLIQFVVYLHEEGRNYCDMKIVAAKLWKPSEEDLKIIADDWSAIVEKIRSGGAHELSEGDTLYLGAVTKAQNSREMRTQPFGPSAKRRAFSLKQSYVNQILGQLLGKEVTDAESVIHGKADYSQGRTFEDIVKARFEPYIGMTVEQVHERVGQDLNPKAKDYFAAVARRIMGARSRRVKEFEKAGIIMKTVRLRANGTPKEAMSFPAFKFKGLVQEIWDESALKSTLESRFFFVAWQYDEAGQLRLRNVKFWNMPVADLEGEVKKTWEDTRNRILAGRADDLPKSTESEICHVRPHGMNAADTDETPGGRRLPKQAFWLNVSYIKDVLQNQMW